MEDDDLNTEMSLLRKICLVVFCIAAFMAVMIPFKMVVWEGILWVETSYGPSAIFGLLFVAWSIAIGLIIADKRIQRRKRSARQH